MSFFALSLFKAVHNIFTYCAIRLILFIIGNRLTKTLIEILFPQSMFFTCKVFFGEDWFTANVAAFLAVIFAFSNSVSAKAKIAEKSLKSQPKKLTVLLIHRVIIF